MSDMQEEMLIIKKKAKANDMKVKFISKTWGDALNHKKEYAGVNVVVNKELYDEYKGTLQEQIEELQDRINKAIEYINEMCLCSDGYCDYGDDLNPEHIINILKGKEK